ncbi:MAG TPA: macro domain-containing protein [Thermoplasmata archaeon]|nr:macro domain-containing protein [Thermoplasmata archaeon]
MAETWNYMDTEIEVVMGDITDLKVEAIVNAANNHLKMVSGVSGAIKARGGQIIEEEAVKQGPIHAGEAIVTTPGALKARHVIHAATIGQDQTSSPDKVRRATMSSFKRADEKRVKSIAFPALGAGVGEVSLQEAARVMVDAMMEYLRKGGSGLQRITFVLRREEGVQAFSDELRARLR